MLGFGSARDALGEQRGLATVVVSRCCLARLGGILEGLAALGDELHEPVSRNTVSFVRDYVEVRINYTIVRCMSRPIVRTASGDFRFPRPGSRDALCGLIDRVVKRVEVSDDVIELQMDSDEILVLPLDQKSRTLSDGRVLPEAVHFVPTDERGRLDTARMAIW